MGNILGKNGAILVSNNSALRASPGDVNVPLTSYLLKGDGTGGIIAATPGTDYATFAQIEAKYTKPSTGIPASDLASGVLPSYRYDPNESIYLINDCDISAKYDGNADEITTKYATKTELNTRYSSTNPPPYPVSSVNGKTGAAVLNASDILTSDNKTINEALGARVAFSNFNERGPVVGADITLQKIYDPVHEQYYLIPQGTYSKPAGGIPASDLAPGISEPIRHEYEEQSGINIAIENHHEYYLYDSSATFTYPSGYFECYIYVEFQGSAELTFPSWSSYVGSVPYFTEDTTWEIRIKNGIISAMQVI